jgi:NADH-quinone oxidoreductase subunit E
MRGGGLLGEIDRIAEVLLTYKQDPRYLLAVLLDIQESENYISTEAMRAVAQYLGVSESRVFAVATFYRTLSMKKKGRKIIRVCMGTACHLRGSVAVLHELEKRFGIKAGDVTENGEFTLETVNCVGACALAPVITCGDDSFGRMDPAKAAELITKGAFE